METGRPFPLPLLLLLAFFFSVDVARANFYKHFDITWGKDRARILENGKQLQLSLDQTSGCGFQSKNEYLLANIDMQIKLVPGNSAGTVTAYYVRYFLHSFYFETPLHLLLPCPVFHALTPCCEMVSAFISRPQTRQNRLRVSGECVGRALHHAHQCLFSGPWKPRAAILLVVRPNSEFPHLLCFMDCTPNYVCFLLPKLFLTMAMS